jgi:hypothetical protein
MKEIDSKIVQFNKYVKRHVRLLQAVLRKDNKDYTQALSDDLLRAIFKGYEATCVPTFNQHIQGIRRYWIEQSRNLSPDSLMELAVDKFAELVKAGQWKHPGVLSSTIPTGSLSKGPSMSRPDVIMTQGDKFTWNDHDQWWYRSETPSNMTIRPKRTLPTIAETATEPRLSTQDHHRVDWSKPVYFEDTPVQDGSRISLQSVPRNHPGWKKRVTKIWRQ